MIELVVSVKQKQNGQIPGSTQLQLIQKKMNPRISLAGLAYTN